MQQEVRTAQNSRRGWELSTGVWLLWTGAGLSAALASAEFHWVVVQFVGIFFYSLWGFFNLETRKMVRSFSFFVSVIFFKHFDVAGAHRVPKTGAVILVCAPHANQFVDGVVVLRSIAHRGDIYFITAAVTMRRKFVGGLIGGLGAVPVERPQDLKRKGTGTLSAPADSVTITGDGTQFTEELKKGDSLIIAAHDGLPQCSLTVSLVRSDTEIEVKSPAPHALEGTKFVVMPHIDQKDMFNAVYDHLGAGGTLAIFPEGGSHDRTSLLEVKAGLTIMALGAMAKYPDLKVTIVPVGLNYFRGHRFRSRAFADIGEPVIPTQEQLRRFNDGGPARRAACTELLERVVDGLRSVTVEAPDYDTLQFFRLMRRLYMPTYMQVDDADTSSKSPPRGVTTPRERPESVQQRYKLMKAFSNGYKQVQESKDVQALYRGVTLYRRMLKSHNVPDHAVATRSIGGKNSDMDKKSKIHHLVKNMSAIVFFFLISLPGLFLCLPLLIVTRIISRKKAVEAVKKSSVKLAGRDVLATWKLLVSFVMLPTMHIVYTTTVFIWYGLTMTILYFFFSPFVGFFTMLATEQMINRIRATRLLCLSLCNADSADWLYQYRDDLRQRTQEVVGAHDWDKALDSDKELYRQGSGWSNSSFGIVASPVEDGDMMTMGSRTSSTTPDGLKRHVE